ncbi:c1q globular head domain containing protein [uncultured Mediterranean phage uvMED]|nr:c1q globular head domain containing protein [uncultured Mediterranean phage uvMED]
MGYLGNAPGESFISFAKQVFTIVNSQTAYTLNFAVVDENELRLVINNVVQEPGSGKAYTASGTTLTLSAALTNGTDEMYCVFLGKARETVTVPTITKDKLNLISTSSSAGLEVKGDGTTDGTLQLNCSQNSHGIKLASPPHSAGQSYTLTFPQSISADTFLKTDGSGNLSFASAGGTNTPAFQATMSGSQSYSNNTSTKVDFDTEQFDTAGAYDHSTNQRFTVPSGQAGKYFIYAKIFYDDVASTDAVRKIHIYKNGSNSGTGSKRTVGTTGRDFTVEASQMYDLSVGDYIEIYLNTNAGSGTINGSANNDIFGGFKIIE